MRKEYTEFTYDGGIWGTTVTMVPGPLNEKWPEIFRFLFGRFVPMAICHGFITQDDEKHYHDYYDMLHDTIGPIATTQ